jgi:pyridoxine 5-phosphate synthase
VPDAQNQLTSDHGWDTIAEQCYLQDIIGTFHAQGIRTSIFLNPDPEFIAAAKTTGTDRIELYTETYAHQYSLNREKAIAPFVTAAIEAQKQGLGLNAGHDLNLENLSFFAQNMPGLLEVSIGHALVCDALYLGLENTIQLYLRALRV